MARQVQQNGLPAGAAVMVAGQLAPPVPLPSLAPGGLGEAMVRCLNRSLAGFLGGAPAAAPGLTPLGGGLIGQPRGGGRRRGCRGAGLPRGRRGRGDERDGRAPLAVGEDSCRFGVHQRAWKEGQGQKQEEQERPRREPKRKAAQGPQFERFRQEQSDELEVGTVSELAEQLQLGWTGAEVEGCWSKQEDRPLGRQAGRDDEVPYSSGLGGVRGEAPGSADRSFLGEHLREGAQSAAAGDPGAQEDEHLAVGAEVRRPPGGPRPARSGYVGVLHGLHSEEAPRGVYGRDDPEDHGHPAAQHAKSKSGSWDKAQRIELVAPGGVGGWKVDGGAARGPRGLA